VGGSFGVAAVAYSSVVVVVVAVVVVAADVAVASSKAWVQVEHLTEEHPLVRRRVEAAAEMEQKKKVMMITMLTIKKRRLLLAQGRLRPPKAGRSQASRQPHSPAVFRPQSQSTAKKRTRKEAMGLGLVLT